MWTGNLIFDRLCNMTRQRDMWTSSVLQERLGGEVSRRRSLIKRTGTQMADWILHFQLKYYVHGSFFDSTAVGDQLFVS